MRIVTIHSIPHQYSVELAQHEDRQGLFRVTYGCQVTDNLTYEQASAEFGSCLLHAATCEGLANDVTH
jgi:hypothetical protein